jgi:hypothetical protein
MDASALGGTTPITLPQSPQPDPNAFLGLTSTAQTVTDSFTQQAQADQLAADKAVELASKQKAEGESALGQRLQSLLGRGEVTQQAMDAGGVTQQKKEVAQDIERLTALNNAFNTQFAAQEGQGRGITLGIIGGQQAAIRRQQAVEIGNLSAMVQAKQGNIQAAEDTINKTLDYKYRDLELQFNYEQKKLDSLGDDLTKKEQERKDARQATLDAQKAQLAEKKDKEKGVQSIMLEAAKNGASSQMLSSISKAGSVEEAIRMAGSSLSTPSTDVVKLDNGNTVVIDKRTGNIIKNLGGGAETGGTIGQLAQAQVTQNIMEIDALKNARGINKAVGPTFLGRWTPFKADVMTGDVSSFIAGVEQVTSNLSLESLIQAKSRGATFGALSDSELKMLASSASKIGTWRKKDDAGNVVGYSASEKDMKKELDRISNFAKKDYILRGGDITTLENVKQTPDGKIWTINSDGSLTQLQ